MLIRERVSSRLSRPFEKSDSAGETASLAPSRIPRNDFPRWKGGGVGAILASRGRVMAVSVGSIAKTRPLNAHNAAFGSGDYPSNTRFSPFLSRFLRRR